MRTALAILLATTLAACETTPAIPVAAPKLEPMVYHPQMPKPLAVCDVTWKVLVVDNTPYVALTYEDNINFAVCAKDLERYLSELTLVVCQYRQCSKESNDPTIRFIR